MDPHFNGPCCACGQKVKTRNIIALDRKRPTPGKGWGCVVCDLPPDGALAVVCDECFDGQREIRFVAAGYISEPERIPVDELPEDVFEHDCKVDH